VISTNRISIQISILLIIMVRLIEISIKTDLTRKQIVYTTLLNQMCRTTIRTSIKYKIIVMNSKGINSAPVQ
jgi:hypothetical protein